jgi:hypothetical protein
LRKWLGDPQEEGGEGSAELSFLGRTSENEELSIKNEEIKIKHEEITNFIFTLPCFVLPLRVVYVFGLYYSRF